MPGDFGGSGHTDLLFYDAGAHTGEFYATTGNGGISQIHINTDWRSSWTRIVPGQFSREGRTDLLFYEGATGVAEFYATSNGRISLLAQHTNWRTNWTNIVPGVYAPLRGIRLHVKVLTSADPLLDPDDAGVDARGLRPRRPARPPRLHREPQPAEPAQSRNRQVRRWGFGDNITGEVADLYSNRRFVAGRQSGDLLHPGHHAGFLEWLRAPSVRTARRGK